MRGDKVRRRQSTETLCCFTPPHPLCVLTANVVCLFTKWLDLAGRNVHSFPFLRRLLLCLSLWFFSIHVSLFFISLSLSICPSVYVSFSLVLPLKTPDLTLKVLFFFFFFWLITLGIFPAFERSSSAACSSSISAYGAGESHANYPGYWLLQRRGCDLHEVTFSSNVQTFATFLWKTINSAAFPSASLLYPLFLSLHHSLSLFLWLLSSQTEKICCQKSEACARRWNSWCIFSVASEYLLVN